MEGDTKELIIRHLTEGEIHSFIKVWISAYLSLCYCFFAAKKLTKPTTRLPAFLPVLCLFLLLPLQLHSVHLAGTTAFFLTWLSTFKILMFAFHKGPLSATPPISLPKFLAVASLPIKLQQQNPSPKLGNTTSFINFGVKALLFALIIKTYDYEDSIHPSIITVLYCFHIYLCLEIMLFVAAATARGLLGADLEPQFDKPYLSTSLQDFWGRRWNLMVTGILRPTVYIPVVNWSTAIVGRKWAALPAVMSTFIVSGLMHELVFYYLCRVTPTWEITWFFVFHGGCLMVEIVVKKAVDGRWRLPRIVGTILIVGIFLATAFWWFFPQLLRCKAEEKAVAEIAAFGAFVKTLFAALWI